MPDGRARAAALTAALLAVAALTTFVLVSVGWPASDYRHSDVFQFWAAPHALLDGGSPRSRSR